MATGDTAQVTAADLQKQIEAETTEVVEAEEEVEVKETEAKTDKEETESETEEEPEEQETTEADKGSKKVTLKVKGKEEEFDLTDPAQLQKVIEYAQKGRFLEQEQHRLKEAEKELEAKKTGGIEDFDWKKGDEQFQEEAQKEGVLKTVAKLVNTIVDLKMRSTEGNQKVEREFVKEKSALPHWASIKETYEDYRDAGMDREKAFLLAENDFLRGTVVTATKKGLKEGKAKAEMKQWAKLPKGTTKTTKNEGMPSDDEIAKMPASELEKRIKQLSPG
jgi:hypothetical protein